MTRAFRFTFALGLVVSTPWSGAQEDPAPPPSEEVYLDAHRGEGENEWIVSWSLGKTAMSSPPADQPHDLLLLSSPNGKSFDIIRRFQSARPAGVTRIALASGHGWICLQETAQIGGERLLEPLELRTLNLPEQPLATLRDELSKRYPRIRAELRRGDAPFPDREILTVGPLPDHHLVALDLPWNPSDAVAICGWVRVRGGGQAFLSLTPVTGGGKSLAGWRIEAQKTGEDSRWKFGHGEVLQPPARTTSFRLMIGESSLEQGKPVWLDLCDLRLKRTPGPPQPPTATLLGRVPGQPTALAFFRDSPRLAIGFTEGAKVAVFDTETKKLVAQKKVGEGQIWWIAAQGDRVFAVDSTPALWRYDLSTGAVTMLGRVGRAQAIAAVSPDGRFFAEAISQKQIRIAEFKGDELVEVATKEIAGIESLAFEGEQLRICTNIETSLYHTGSGKLTEPATHGQTSFRRPVYNHSLRVWTDPARRHFYKLGPGTIEAVPTAADQPGLSFATGLSALAIRPSDGQLFLADDYGQLWSHPPFPVPTE